MMAARSSRQITAHEISLISFLTAKLKPLAVLAGSISALGAVVAMIFYGWGYVGLPTYVNHRELDNVVTVIKSDVGNKVGEAKTAVTGILNQNTTEIKNDIEGVKQNLARTTLTTLETSQRSLFTSLSNLRSQLNTINQQLHERPTDSFLIQKKAETEQLISYLEREQTTVSEQLRAGRAAVR